MTSPFARTGQLSPRTLATFDALPGLKMQYPHITQPLVNFFCSYLRDVAPRGITVHYISVVPNSQRSRSPVKREEILLMTEQGKIFVSGLVSWESFAASLETTAGDEARTNWEKGEFTPDGNRWRFFIGMTKWIRLFSSPENRWDRWFPDGRFHPIDDAARVAAILQQKFDKIQV